MDPVKREELRESLKEFGQLHEILVTDDNYIIEGTVRWQLMKELNWNPDIIRYHNVTYHSGIGGKLPRTIAYKHADIEEERKNTEELIESLRPWSWSTPIPTHIPTHTPNPIPNPIPTHTDRKARQSLVLAWLKVNGPATASEIKLYLRDQGCPVSTNYISEMKRRGFLQNTGKTKPRPQGGGPAIHFLEPTPSS